MRRAKRAIAIVTFTLVSSCTNQTLPAATPTSSTTTLRLFTTTATVRLARDVSLEYGIANPDLSVEVPTGNYETLLDDLYSGDVSYFLTNHLPADSPLWAAPVGQDGIGLIVHPDNPIQNLSIEQLRDIFRGNITNWQQVGGTDTPIDVVSREDGSGTRAEFDQLVMGNRRATPSARLAPSSIAMVTSVASLPGSIGYVSMGHVDDTVRALSVNGTPLSTDTVYDNAYPLRSTLFIVGLEEPETDYRVLVAWLQSPEGQAVIGRQHAPLVQP